MKEKINKERLKDTFSQLVSIDSPSKEEGEFANFLKTLFSIEFGYKVKEDSSKDKTGSNSGNLLVEVPGNPSLPPLFFNAHLDTVEPGRGIQPIFRDGKFFTDGSTILGSDDKAAIAILIEITRHLKEHDIVHPPLEYLFTVCEEIGLLGAKAIDPSFLRAKSGYALDSTGIYVLINKAPCATRFKIKVLGKASHAGLNPEEGINAIQLASMAISGLKLGRIDEETTANIGLINGGKATNIIPDEAVVEGEVRSHNKDKLRRVQDEIIGRFNRVVTDFKEEAGAQMTTAKMLPLIQAEVLDDYPIISIEKDHELVRTAVSAANAMGRELKIMATGGGSDANIFNGKGLDAVILGVGMQKVHSQDEFIMLEDMAHTAELVLEIINEWGRSKS